MEEKEVSSWEAYAWAALKGGSKRDGGPKRQDE